MHGKWVPWQPLQAWLVEDYWLPRNQMRPPRELLPRTVLSNEHYVFAGYDNNVAKYEWRGPQMGRLPD